VAPSAVLTAGFLLRKFKYAFLVAFVISRRHHAAGDIVTQKAAGPLVGLSNSGVPLCLACSAATEERGGVYDPGSLKSYRGPAVTSSGALCPAFMLDHVDRALQSRVGIGQGSFPAARSRRPPDLAVAVDPDHVYRELAVLFIQNA